MDLPGLKSARESGNLVAFLGKFNGSNASVMDFSQVDFFCRKELVSVVESEFTSENWDKLRANALLNTLRLLARDDKNVDVIFSSEPVQNYVCWLAGLPLNSKHPTDPDLVVEARKCLVNALFKSAAMQQAFERESQTTLRESLIEISSSKSLNERDLLVFHLSLRILFITTAVQVPARKLWKEDPFFSTVINLLDITHGSTEMAMEDKISSINELLKTLFSLFCKKDPQEDLEKSSETLKRVKTLLCSPMAENAECQQNCVNLISTLPEMPDILSPKVTPDNKSAEQLEGRDMSIVQRLLENMEKRIDENDLNHVAIYLTAILGYCTANSQVRRYVRLMVLPPLKDIDVNRLPDEGDTLRNKLVRVMKGIGNEGLLASNLMFVLCKQSVGRMIKYTGFGHSAGLLANNQLLGHVNLPKNGDNSEDSETEEYAAVEDQVNPVTGCIRPPDKASAFEGMSEEQKEYEASKLMEAMNQLMNAGVFQPGTVGEDGKVRPFSHLLEMTKNINIQDKNSEDSD